MDPYYQGDDIILNIGGIGSVDLDALDDFTVGLYTNTPAMTTFHKSELTKTPDGLYQCVLPSSVSKGLAPGWYTIEIFLSGSRKTCLKCEKLFLIKDFRLRGTN